MKRDEFYNKTPTQVRVLIRKMRIKKDDILDMLEECNEYQLGDCDLTIMELCKKHEEAIKDWLWDMFCEAQ